jgi:hypothetical protein
MKSIGTYLISVAILFTGVVQYSAAQNQCGDMYASTLAIEKVIKQGSLFGQPLSQIKKLEAQKVSQVVAELKSKGIQHELISHGSLFTSILIKPTGSHSLSLLAQNFLTTRSGLKLLISPVLSILLKDAFGAGYFGYKNLVFPTELKDTSNKDLILLSDAIITEHSIVSNPDFVEKLKLDSPLIRHELHHAEIESDRKKAGPDERAIRGQYKSGFKGFSYNGELNVEEAYVWLGDLVSAAKGIKGSVFPKFPSTEEISRMTTADVPTNDAQRLVMIQHRSGSLAEYGASISEAAQSFFVHRPTDIRFREWSSQIWSLFTLKVPNPDGTMSELYMRMPVKGSKGLLDNNNIRLLEQAVFEMHQTGVALSSLGQFVYGIFETFKSGNDLSYYPLTVKFLQKISGVKDLKNTKGEAFQIDEIIDQIQNSN